MRKLLVGPMVAFGLYLGGCASISTLGTARTLDQGQLQFAVSPGINAFVRQPNAPGIYEGPPGAPNLELAGRCGLTDHVEMGLKAWLFGGQVDTKFSLLRSRPEGGVDVALAPAVGYVFMNAGPTSANQAAFHFPLLLGLNLGGFQILVGPRLVDLVSWDTSTQVPKNILLAGTSFGVAVRVGDGLQVMPEVSVQVPLTDSGGTAYFMQLGVALLFGGYKPSPLL